MIETKVMWEDAPNVIERGDVLYLTGLGFFRITCTTRAGVTMQYMNPLSALFFAVWRIFSWGR